MIYAKAIGGLGNQLFIYAFTRVLQLKYGQEVQLDISDIGHGPLQLDKFNISDTVHLKNCWDKAKKKHFIRIFFARSIRHIFFEIGRTSLPLRYFFEKISQPLLNYFGFYIIEDGYCKMHYNSPCKNIIAMGYFQSSQYFELYLDIIKKELKVATKVGLRNADIYNKILSTKSVCLHIRRGDYLDTGLKEIYQICTLDYYNHAIKKMTELIPDAAFFVFSDDMSWVKSNLKIAKNFEFVDNENAAFEDLQLMYSCKHFILSNSSFSWWAQYLSDNSNKIVIVPDRWYKDKRRADLYMNHWIIMPTKTTY